MFSIKLPLLLPLLLSIRGPSLLRALRRLSGGARSFAQDFAQDRSGAVAITLALSLTAIIGLAALATEGAQWYQIKRTMQGAADSAAYAAATAKAAGASQSTYTDQAKAITGDYGFADGGSGVVVTVNSPPASGSHSTDATAVEVLISRPQPLVLAGMFVSAPTTIGARAVAAGAPSGCVLALDRSDINDLSEVGTTELDLRGCDLYINSPSPTALTMSGKAIINADAANISGNYTTSGQASLNTSRGTNTGVAPANDPYADVQIPAYAGCDQTNYALTAGGYQSLKPNSSGVMVFCNGFSLSGNSSVDLAPGIYVIDRGKFYIGGGSSISGTGVTIVLTSSTGSNYATVQIDGGAVVTLSAPTSGPLAGLAFFQDRNAPASGSSSFSGGSTQNITGAIYFPNQSVSFNGGTSSGGASQCTQLVALRLSFNGNSTFNNNCTGVAVRGIGTSFVQVVE